MDEASDDHINDELEAKQMDKRRQQMQEQEKKAAKDKKSADRFHDMGGNDYSDDEDEDGDGLAVNLTAFSPLFKKQPRLEPAKGAGSIIAHSRKQEYNSDDDDDDEKAAERAKKRAQARIASGKAPVSPSKTTTSHAIPQSLAAHLLSKVSPALKSAASPRRLSALVTKSTAFEDRAAKILLDGNKA
jgi:hypothetical protein